MQVFAPAKGWEAMRRVGVHAMRGKYALRAGPRVALYGAICVFLFTRVAGELSAGAASHERSLGDKALMEGKLNVALKHFESAVKMNPADHLNWYKRATAYIIDKKYESALRDLGKVLALDGVVLSETICL